MSLTRRQFGGVTGAALWNASQTRKPNIVVILCDDLGYGDTGCYGNGIIRTPHIDSLAMGGVLLKECYAAPTCTPSRAALLTGRYPLRSGLTRVLIPREHFGIPDSEITLASALKQEGYRTACIGKWHLGDAPRYRPNRHGFDYFYGVLYSHDMRLPFLRWPPVRLFRNEIPIESPIVQRTMTRRFTDEAIQFLEANKQRPFFLYLAYTMPHLPWRASEQFARKSSYGPYGDVVEELDSSVGEIMARIRKLGLAEDTIVIFTSDNGPEPHGSPPGGSAGELRGYKATCWEGGVRVPCIMSWPGRLPVAQRRGICSLMDLFATICAIAAVKFPPDHIVDGLNLEPFLMGKSRSPRNSLAYYHHGLLYAIRSENWKLHFLRPPNGPANRLRNPIACAPPELYNLDADIAESNQVGAQHPEIVRELTGLAADYRASIAAGRRTPSRLRSLLPGKRFQKGPK